MGSKNRKAAIAAAAEKRTKTVEKYVGKAPETPLEKTSAIIMDEVDKDMDKEIAARAEAKAKQEADGDKILADMNKEAEKSAPALTASQPTASAAPAPSVTTGGKLANRLRSSAISLPTKMVWEIADIMKKANPNVRRKDVIAECIKQGIATYTAMTQYQRWFTAHKADAVAVAPKQATASNG